MNNSRPWILGLVVAVTIACVLAPLAQHDKRGGFEMQKFGRLPVLLNGRIKPLDTVARNALLIIQGKQTLATEHGEMSPIDWLAEVMMKSSEADRRKIFVIRSPVTRASIGRSDPTEEYFSFLQLTPHLQEIEQQAELAQKVDAQLRSPFQR
ncbi:MAG: cytochrome c biogenesis protein, partial [Chthoniobacterales bacterium]